MAKYKEGDKKDIGFWFIVTGFWLKEKNQKQQTRDRKPNLYSNRVKAALPVWINFMSKALEYKQNEAFNVPDGIVSVDIDPATGLPASSESKSVATALYRKGTEPE